MPSELAPRKLGQLTVGARFTAGSSAPTRSAGPASTIFRDGLAQGLRLTPGSRETNPFDGSGPAPEDDVDRSVGRAEGVVRDDLEGKAFLAEGEHEPISLDAGSDLLA